MRSDQPKREDVEKEIDRLAARELWKVRLLLGGLSATAAMSSRLGFTIRYITGAYWRLFDEWIMHHPDIRDPLPPSLATIGRTITVVELLVMALWVLGLVPLPVLMGTYVAVLVVGPNLVYDARDAQAS